MGLFNLANFAFEDKQLPDAERNLLDAIPIFERLLNESPNDLRNQSRLATCHRRLGDLQVGAAEGMTKRGMLDESREMRDEALADFYAAEEAIELVAYQNPQVLEFRVELAAIRIGSGVAELDQGYLQRAERSFVLARDSLSPLVESGSAESEHDLAKALRELGRCYSKMNQPQEAAASLRESMTLFDRLLSRDGNDAGYLSGRQLTEKALSELQALPAKPPSFP